MSGRRSVSLTAAQTSGVGGFEKTPPEEFSGMCKRASFRRRSETSCQVVQKKIPLCAALHSNCVSEGLGVRSEYAYGIQ